MLCGFAGSFEGVVGTATLTDRNGTVLAKIAPMSVPGAGSGYTLYEFPVTYGTPATAEGILRVDADNPSGLPENDFRVTVPLTFARALTGSAHGGFSTYRVQAGDTLFTVAEQLYGDGSLWPRLFIANRDRITDPDLVRAGQILRIPNEGP